jgi:hypothetical protein
MPSVKEMIDRTEPEADTPADTVETPSSKSTALVPEVPAGLFADDAKQINVRLKKAEDYRVEAGRMLLKLRPKVEAAGVGWEAWCKVNIDRSYRDVQKVMALAKAPDPEAAGEQERERNRIASRESRERKGASDASRPSKPVAANEKGDAPAPVTPTGDSTNSDEARWDKLRRDEGTIIALFDGLPPATRLSLVRTLIWKSSFAHQQTIQAEVTRFLRDSIGKLNQQVRERGCHLRAYGGSRLTTDTGYFMILTKAKCETYAAWRLENDKALARARFDGASFDPTEAPEFDCAPLEIKGVEKWIKQNPATGSFDLNAAIREVRGGDEERDSRQDAKPDPTPPKPGKKAAKPKPSAEPDPKITAASPAADEDDALLARFGSKPKMEPAR